jgi:hypothetical protein
MIPGVDVLGTPATEPGDEKLEQLVKPVGDELNSEF